jgi:hypothetical protein
MTSNSRFKVIRWHPEELASYSSVHRVYCCRCGHWREQSGLRSKVYRMFDDNYSRNDYPGLDFEAYSGYSDQA